MRVFISTVAAGAGRARAEIGRRLTVSLLHLGVLAATSAPGAEAVTELKRDEQAVVFPSLAFPQADGSWSANLRVMVYEWQRRPLILPALEKAIGLARRELTPAEQTFFEERARWLMIDHERGKQVVVAIGGQTFDLGKTSDLGQARRTVTLTTAGPTDVGRGLTVEVPVRPGDARRITGELHLLTATGLSVVSDIDDTIKVSVVTNKPELLKNTFVRPFREVPGMAALYRHWREQRGAAFHYVSASPWQLYTPLAEFARSNAFPAGSFHMKEFRWRDENILKLFGSPAEYKIASIEPLLRGAPMRRFVLVGDSGERDPEAYGELARRHPHQVAAIFIRELAGETAASPRYQRAFHDVPSDRWRIFQSPAEIRDALP